MGSLEKSSAASEVVTIDVKAAKDLVDSGYVYLDVRTAEEYKKGHVDAEKILNIPYIFITPEGRMKNPEFLKEVSSVCKEDNLLVVGCQSGARSLSATTDLLSAAKAQQRAREAVQFYAGHKSSNVSTLNDSKYHSVLRTDPGFKHVSNMGGGHLAWVENGFSVKVDMNPEEKPKEEL